MVYVNRKEKESLCACAVFAENKSDNLLMLALEEADDAVERGEYLNVHHLLTPIKL